MAITLTPDYLFISYDKNGQTYSGNLNFLVRAKDDSNAPISVIFVENSPLVLPSTAYDGESVSITINTTEADALSVGIYNYEITVNPFDSPTVLSATVNVDLEIKDTSSSGGGYDPIPEIPIFDYELKYYLEYTNTEGDLFRLDILKNNGQTNSYTKIYGKVVHEYAERKDLNTPIMASSLKIDLEANSDLTLSDLYSENEREFQVKFYKNSQLIFIGFLKPDGIWEDFVSDRWVISMDAIDGLSTLKELSFVREINKKPFEGKISHFDVIKGCLDRIGLDLPINVNLALETKENNNFLDVLVDTERFYQDSNGKDVMNCEDVLKSTLQIANASIIQMNGEWYIFRVSDLQNSTTFKRFENGLPVADSTLTLNKTVGSHINNADIFHVNSNQKKSIKPSIQAYRVNYKFGVSSQGLINPDLKFLNGTSNMEGWTWFPEAGKLRQLNTYAGIQAIGSTASYDILITNSQTISVNTDDVLTFSITFENYGYSKGCIFSLTTDNYYFSYGEWKSKSGSTEVIDWFNNLDNYYKKGGNYGGSGIANFDINLPPIPEDGAVTIKIRRWTGTTEDLRIHRIDLKASSTGNHKGFNYTGQRTTRISTVTKADITVYNGDSISDIYVGTLYNPDETPTTAWNRVGIVEEKEILAIAVEDILRMSPRPMIYFEGDVYGYLRFLDLISIDAVSGDFVVSKYSYDTYSNIISCSFSEIERDFLLPEDFTVEKTVDFGEPTKSSIK